MKCSFQVDVARQVVEVRRGDEIIWQAPVSTSSYGLGETPDSYKTPRGWHRVAEKIGEHEPLGRVFRARQAQPEIWAAGNEVDAATQGNDLILTRILWLAGEEPENETTYNRYVYFHGTNQEALIGCPASHGCIRLGNADMIRLFDLAEAGTRVWIG